MLVVPWSMLPTKTSDALPAMTSTHELVARDLPLPNLAIPHSFENYNDTRDDLRVLAVASNADEARAMCGRQSAFGSCAARDGLRH